MLDKNNVIHLLVLVAGMLASSFIAVSIGKELNWDLASYHYYNPLAFLQHRQLLDVWPSEYIHVHLTPTADFITYYFITYLQPKTAVMLLGALHGINFWLLFLIAAEIFGTLSSITYPRALAIVVAIIGMCGPAVLPGLGSFQHDLLVSLFVLSAIYLLLKACRQRFPLALLLGSGLMLGVGAGLKLTAVVYVLGAMITVCMMRLPLKQRAVMLLAIGGGVAAGVLVTSGYWMWMQWQQFHSPLFPFMNAVFQAPDFPAVNWKDARFMPKSILEAVLFPFYFSLDGRTNDLPFRDVRFAIVYVLLVVACLRWIYQRACGVKSREKTDIAVLWLLVFFVVSYVIWQLQFSIMRYAMPLEMLAPLVIFLLLNTMMQDKLVLAGSVFAAYAFILIAISPAPAVRAPWYAGNYFNVQLPLAAERQEPAMVLLPVSAYAFNLKPRPQTYLIGSLPPSWRYIGVAFNGEKITVGVRAPEVIKHFNGRLFLLASGEFLPQMYQAAASLGLSAAGACDDIKSDRQKITYEDVKLCPLKK